MMKQLIFLSIIFSLTGCKIMQPLNSRPAIDSSSKVVQLPTGPISTQFVVNAINQVNLLTRQMDTLMNKALILNPNEFYISNGVASLKKQSGVDTLIHAPRPISKGLTKTIKIEFGGKQQSQKDIDIADLKLQKEFLIEIIDSMQNVIDRQQRVIGYR